MSLIARHLESVGIATTSLSSAWSITASANPPRVRFFDAPLGHTAGPPRRPDAQRTLVAEALELATRALDAPVIEPSSVTWIEAPAEVWKAEARALADHRSPRHDTPQYDRPDDAEAASS